MKMLIVNNEGETVRSIDLGEVNLDSIRPSEPFRFLTLCIREVIDQMQCDRKSAAMASDEEIDREIAEKHAGILNRLINGIDDWAEVNTHVHEWDESGFCSCGADGNA